MDNTLLTTSEITDVALSVGMEATQADCDIAIANAASAKGYRAACLVVTCAECGGVADAAPGGEWVCPACDGTGKRTLTGEQVARVLIDTATRRVTPELVAIRAAMDALDAKEARP